MVRQRFIQGTAPTEDEITVGGLEDFRQVTENKNPPDYATPWYLLGDLHDRNIIIDSKGLAHVIDCNVFLNTPDLGKGGEWIIPEVESDPAALEEIDAALKKAGEDAAAALG